MTTDNQIVQPAGTSGEGDGGGPVELPASTEPSGGTAPDWEHESNPYKARYTGIQSTTRQMQAENQRLQAETQRANEGQMQAAERMALLEAQVQGKSEEEIGQLRGTLQERRQIATFAQKLQQDATAIQAIKARLNPIARMAILSDIAEKYHVDRKELEDAPNADAAEFAAQKLAAKVRKDALEKRKEEGTDRVETPSGGGLDLSKLSAHEKLERGIAAAKRPR